LIHPGSGGQPKCCDLEALEHLILVLERRGLSTAWIIGPDEIERLGNDYADRLSSTAPLIYEESVAAAADLVAAADTYIGMDAGMTHVAALAGVTTVALFGPTDPSVWRPLGGRVHVLPFPAAPRPTAAWLKKLERCALSD
jgi:ADP-heptose:LPS heptosyltransferase